MNTLIIAEKPSVASRIAAALSNDKATREQGKGKVSYYEVKNGANTIYIAAAVGHLFSIKQKDKVRGYPVLDIEWAPAYEVGSRSEHTKEYLETLVALAKKCDMLINACDFDIEGTVIGTNIIRFAKGTIQESKSRRMKFSTTTEEDLKEAYSKLMPLDLNNFYAGEARHMLDWLWGINLSRALTFAVRGNMVSNALSIGRVQGPSLAILAKREAEISAFKSKPFWRITATVKEIAFLNKREDMFDEQVAKDALEETNKHKSSGIIEASDTHEQIISPYPPFDLTSLQLEASRALHIDPSVTLQIAQSLYERALISYPRTSSQKLPSTLGLPKIIAELAKNHAYSDIARNIISKKRFKPVEGTKIDAAHPAIFPTGLMATGLSSYEERLYDLIARRFLACFAEPAKVAREKLTAKFGKEQYTAAGSRILEQGWLSFYTYARIDEKILPEFKKGEHVAASRVEMASLMTQPPRRYTKAGLISELEKKDLGTKATRAQIIDTLFKRKYLEGTSIKVTEFGMTIYDTLSKNCAMIVDDQTTRRLEEDMEKISKGEIKEEDVIKEGKEMLIKALDQFTANKDAISAELRKSLMSSSILGKCPKDGGDLVIRRSRFGKQFAACANYPKCMNTYSLPQNAGIVPTGETCEYCHTPIVKVIRRGKRPFDMDLDPNCITKKDWASNKKEKTAEKIPPAQQDIKAVPIGTVTPTSPTQKIEKKVTKKKPTKRKTKKAKPSTQDV
jgi:DNA topoisomerase-1